MRRLLVVVVLVCACSVTGPPGSAGAAGAAGSTPLPASPQALQPAPGSAILGAADVGLPEVASADGITAAQAANDVPDAADALPLFSSWGWVTESRRSFGDGGKSVTVTVLLTVRAAGAESAFGFLSEQTAVPPLIAGACPASIGRTDGCADGRGGGQELVVARVGAEVFEIAGSGADPVPAAVRQAAKLAV